MRVQILTLRFESGGFDEAPLRKLQERAELADFREHFFVSQGVPHLACVAICADDSEASAGESASQPRRPSTTEPTDDLDGPQLALFERMREWRSRLAQEDGVPPYAVLTNKQLAEIARARPGSLAELGAIHGVGQKKLERHGEAILAALRATRIDDADTRV